MKKIISLLTVPVIAVYILTGCGESSYDTYTELSTNQPTVTATEDNLDILNEDKNINSFVKKDGKYKYFDISRTEFIKKYDKIHDELDDNVYKVGIGLAEAPYSVLNRDEIPENALSMFPNAYKVYLYDTTLYDANYLTRKTNGTVIWVDENDNVLNVAVSRLGIALSTSEACQYYSYVECAAAYMAITGETNVDLAKDAMYEAYCSPTAGNKVEYEYGFTEEENYDTEFSLRVLN